jgi:hypothetical protein
MGARALLVAPPPTGERARDDNAAHDSSPTDEGDCEWSR